MLIIRVVSKPPQNVLLGNLLGLERQEFQVLGEPDLIRPTFKTSLQKKRKEPRRGHHSHSASIPLF